MIDRESMRYAPAAIMTTDEEALESERAHQLHRIQRHRSLRIRRMIGGARRFIGIAVTTQIRHHQRVTLGELRRNLVPDRVRLRKTMQQQYGGPAAVVP